MSTNSEVLAAAERHVSTGTEAATEPLGAVAMTAAVGSLAAGLIHYAATGLHLPDETAAAVLFTVVGGAQMVWPALLRTGKTWVLVAGIVLNAASVIGWAASRTVGLPIGHHAGTVEPVGLLDTGSAVAGFVVVIAATVLLRRSAHGASDPAGPPDWR